MIIAAVLRLILIPVVGDIRDSLVLARRVLLLEFEGWRSKGTPVYRFDSIGAIVERRSDIRYEDRGVGGPACLLWRHHELTTRLRGTGRFTDKGIWIELRLDEGLKILGAHSSNRQRLSECFIFFGRLQLRDSVSV